MVLNQLNATGATSLIPPKCEILLYLPLDIGSKPVIAPSEEFPPRSSSTLPHFSPALYPYIKGPPFCSASVPFLKDIQSISLSDLCLFQILLSFRFSTFSSYGGLSD